MDKLRLIAILLFAGAFVILAGVFVACAPTGSPTLEPKTTQAPLPASTPTPIFTRIPSSERTTAPTASPSLLRTPAAEPTLDLATPQTQPPLARPTAVATITPQHPPPQPAAPVARPAQPAEVTFNSGNLKLHGFIYQPAGAGPFPAVLWNHGSERLPGWLPELGDLFTSEGYVFFIPHRRGQGRSADLGEYIIDLLDKESRERGQDTRSKLLVTLHETEHLNDQLAGLSYLKGLPYVDANRVAVAGISFGGIQTLLAVEASSQRNLGIRAAVSFAAAAQTWKSSPHLRDRLVTAVRKATLPVFFIQAENDYDLAPGRTLAAEMERLGKPNKLKIFPAFGVTAQEGHEFGVRGAQIWRPDVFPFLREAIQR